MTTEPHPPPKRFVASTRARLGDRAFALLCTAAGIVVLVVLALILVSMIAESVPVWRLEGWRFIFQNKWVPNDIDGAAGPERAHFGAFAFVYGTLIVSGLALLFAVPVSIGIALFVSEVAGRRVRALAVSVLDLLAAVPSVVYGLWGILVVAPNIEPAYARVHDAVSWIPWIGGVLGVPVKSGRSFMTGGIVVAIMITPIITSITREVFATVPENDKLGALALGATRWEMIKGAVFPHSFSGMVGAVMLGLGRAMGETIAIALTLGAATQVTRNLFNAGNALPAVIVQQFGEADGDFRSALIGLGVLLFGITVAVNVLARFVVRRAEVRMRGSLA